MELVQDVTPADEFAIYIYLRNGRPVGIALDPLAHCRIGEHVIGRERKSVGSQNLDSVSGKTALREIGRALHVEHDFIVLYFLINLAQNIFWHKIFSLWKLTSGIFTSRASPTAPDYKF